VGCSGGAVAVYVDADFRTAYPAFAINPTTPTLLANFSIAGAYWRNDGTSPVSDQTLQTNLMYMLTAHLTQLSSGVDGNDPSGIVGRVSSATQGSVTVATEYEANPNAAWFIQTPYGANFWQATAAYRAVAAYRPGPTRFGNGIGRRPFGRGCRAF
jgi:hypothetical protein